MMGHLGAVGLRSGAATPECGLGATDSPDRVNKGQSGWCFTKLYARSRNKMLEKALNPLLGVPLMKKTIAAITAGLLLVAGQAVAQNNSATVRVGDRVGAQADASSEFAGIPIAVLLIGGVVLVAAVVAATDDSSDSN